MSNVEIPCHNLPNCPVCKNTGSSIYTGLLDFLSDLPGTWGMRKCDSKECNTIWLDPAPLPEFVYLLYADYHTHTDPSLAAPQNRNGIKKIFDQMSEVVLAHDLGYPTNLPDWKVGILNFIAKIHPGWRDEKKNQVLYVPYIPNGTLLDVGCGAGNAMQILRSKGWRVVGTDFDNGAVENARSKGLDVRLGDLQDIKFESNSFDAILCCNVIEHAADPDSLVRECLRILKPGGRLTLITNNAISRGHDRFKEHWRGLEIPRHLQIFTPASLKQFVKQIGFLSVRSRGCLQGIYYMWDASAIHEKDGTFNLPPVTKWSRIRARLKSFTSGIKMILAPGKEESILLYAEK